MKEKSLEVAVRKIENCLGHLKGSCPQCVADDKNRFCPNYLPYRLRIFEVKEDFGLDYARS